MAQIESRLTLVSRDDGIEGLVPRQGGGGGMDRECPPPPWPRPVTATSGRDRLGSGRRAQRRAEGTAPPSSSVGARKLPDSVPSPASAHRALARIMAVCGRSHPRTGDQRRAEGTPVAKPCGSNTPTGPRSARAVIVADRLSARVAVVMTAPGASSSIGITTL